MHELLPGCALNPGSPREFITVLALPLFFFFPFPTVSPSPKPSSHVEENMNNLSLFLKFQPPTETTSWLPVIASHFLERESVLPDKGQVAALGQCVELGFLVKYGCLGSL